MARLGRQTPTQSIVLPYTKTKGTKAIRSYQESGRKALQWEKLLIGQIMAVNDDGLWTHSTFGYEVPRQNGKGEVLTIRELEGLKQGENICHTAHRTSTSHSAFVRLMSVLTAAGYVELGRKKKGVETPKLSFKATKQYGLEQIFLTGGGSIVFRTRSEAGGLGESFDLLVIDEAQEYTKAQQSALIYTIAASKNPQTIFCGTPPSLVSRGDVFVDLRKKVLSGHTQDTGWAEWSIYTRPEDIFNVDLWYETNPSLGTILTERKIRNEDVGNDIDFLIQRLGFWFEYELKSEISEADWLNLRVKSVPDLKGKLYASVKFGADGLNVTMTVAVRTADQKIFVEAIDCAPQAAGFAWMVSFLQKASVSKVVIDGKGKTELFSKMLTDSGCKVTQVIPTAAEAVAAYASFRQAVDDGTICHNGQKSLTQAVSKCAKRLIGSNGAFGFRSINSDVDVTLVEGAALAYWLCSVNKERRKQRIGY